MDTDALLAEHPQACAHCAAGEPYEHAYEIDDDTLAALEAATDPFVHGYCVAMLWANTYVATDEDGIMSVDPAWWQAPGWWGIEAFDPDDRDDIRATCEDFLSRCWAWLNDPAVLARGWEAAGHDLALTRNGHGAGFWDRGYGDVGEHLSDYARSLGSSTAWITDPDSDPSDTHAHLDSHDR